MVTMHADVALTSVTEMATENYEIHLQKSI